MPVTLTRYATAHGAVAVTQTAGSGLPLLMLHGSGATGAVFKAQFESPLASHFRLIAVDLPGHGQSDNFADPDHAYTLPAMAQTIAGLFPALGIERALVLGWSLGGHIAIEMMAQIPDQLVGVAISGAPPIEGGPLGALRAFYPNPFSLLAGRAYLSYGAAARLARQFYGNLATPADIGAILDVDPHFRPRMMGSVLRGDGANQRHVVETCPVPLAIIGGADDPVIRPGYFSGLDYAHLWDGKAHFLHAGGHAPFMARPHSFNALLHRFATEAAIGFPRVPERRITRRA